eukprot:3579742-Pleurochrysis_carterae.AAC.10
MHALLSSALKHEDTKAKCTAGERRFARQMSQTACMPFENMLCACHVFRNCHLFSTEPKTPRNRSELATTSKVSVLAACLANFGFVGWIGGLHAMRYRKSKYGK